MRQGLRAILSILTVVLFPGFCLGDIGDLEQQFSFHAGDLAANHVLPYVYATIPASNSLAVIDTRTLTVAKMIALGDTPKGIVVSPDSSKVYISNSSSSIQVLDTSNNQLSTSIPVGKATTNVALGTNNRIWAVDANGVQQFNISSGASSGPNAPVSLSGGKIVISPDGGTLYCGTGGLSPNSLYKVDVSGTGTPTILYSDPNILGGATRLVLSNDGSRLTFGQNVINSNYELPLYRTSDMSIVQEYPIGTYLGGMGFSPDGSVIYPLTAFLTDGAFITAYNTNTAKFIDGFVAQDTASAEVTDNSGQYLFVAFTGGLFGQSTLIVYQVPEPNVCGLAILGIGALRRRSRS